MKTYTAPTVEFIKFEGQMVTEASTCMIGNGYECPTAYGTTCTGNPYGGN